MIRLLLIAMLLFPLTALCQDTMMLSPGKGMAVLGSQRSFIYVDVTHNMWLNRPNEIENNFLSGGFNFNLFYDLWLVKDVFSIAPGISFSNATVKTNVMPAYSITVDEQLDSVILIPVADSSFFNKIKFSTSFIDIPVELRLDIKRADRGKSAWIAPGFRVGFLISDFWKYKLDDNAVAPEKVRTYNNPGVESLRYGISFRAGYHRFGVYGFYALSDVFEEEKAIELTPFSVGVTFTPF